MNRFVADELYLILHDTENGKPLAPEGKVGTCLAAALLCDLILFGALTVEQGRLRPTGRAVPPDRLCAALMERITDPNAEVEPTVAAWLPAPWGGWAKTLRGQSLALVAERVVGTGLAVQVPRRRLGRSSTVVVPTDPPALEHRNERLAAYLRNAVRPGLDQAVMAALNLVAGPRPDPLTGTAQARQFLFTLVPDFPADIRHVVDRADELLDRPLSRGMGK
jgi:hypothetical protein